MTRRSTYDAGKILAQHKAKQEVTPALEPVALKEFNVAEFEKRNREFMKFICEKYLSLEATRLVFDYRDFSSLNYDGLPKTQHMDDVHVLIDTVPIFFQYFLNLNAKPLLSYSDVTQNGKTLAQVFAHAAQKTKQKSFFAGIEDMYLLIGGKQDTPEGWKISNKDTRLVIPGMLICVAGIWSCIYMQIRNNRIHIFREPVSSVYSDARYRFLIRDKTV